MARVQPLSEFTKPNNDKETIMNRLMHQINIPTNRSTGLLASVRQRMAKALIGQAVSLMKDSKTIRHGIVTDVLAEAEVPQIIVDGARYNFNQILTNIPAALSH